MITNGTGTNGIEKAGRISNLKHNR
jgi:hypothetical protein